MSGFTVDFKFEIGDLVFIRSAQHCAGSRPKQFCIVERVAQECPGGLQLHYRLHGYGPSESCLVLEAVLTKEEPEYRPRSEAEVQEMLDDYKTQDLRSAVRWADFKASATKQSDGS